MIVTLPHPKRAGEYQLDISTLPPNTAQTLVEWAADWARLGTEVPFRASLSARLLNLAERAQSVPLDRLELDLRDLAAEAQITHQQGRLAARQTMVGEVAA